MDKQTLRYTFLLYFAGQYAKKEDMEYDTLLEMSDNNYDLCSEVVCDMVKEGLVSGIELIETKAGYAIGQYQGKLKLTSKGLKEIMGLFPEENKEIIDEIQKGNNFIDNKEDLLENFLKKEKNRISQLSNEDKNKEIIEKILSYFKFLNANIHNYPDGKIKSSEIKEKVKNILSIYYEKAPQIFAQKVTKEMLEDYGYITFLYKKISPDEYDIDKLLTSKGASYLEQLEKDYKEKFENYCKENNIKFPDPIGSNAKILKTIINSPTQKAIESVQNFHKNFSNEQLTELIKKANIADRAAQSITNINPITLSPNVIDEVKKDKEGNETKDNKEKSYTFEGILGRNCGTIVPYYDSEQRLQEKGYIVENGIYVLRGYSKMSDLVGASIVDSNNYQRKEDLQHINDIKNFLQRSKISFLPEIILVARNNVKIEEIDLNLKGKQLGRFQNINYRKITVPSKSLYRVDGNHRLEAYDEKGKDYYIPFSIILWHVNEEEKQEDSKQEEKNAIDNEAFLFYLLNAKSKPLTLEENISGIVKSDVNVWKDDNIREINFIFPYLRDIYNSLNNDMIFKKSHYLDNEGQENVWSQYLNILNEIFKKENNSKQPEEEYKISFNKEQCKEIVCNTILLLNQTTRFKYLRENYKKFPQLIFYLQYLKMQDKKNEIDIEADLEDINNWAQKYKHDDSSFENPINMYENAMRQIQRGEINIFVAMPYYNDDTIKQYNSNYQKIVSTIIKKNPKLNDRLKLFPIMTHKGETKNILNYIDKCIENCQIFIADVSDDPSKKNIVNPNVMYELGVARQKSKPCIIIKNAKDDSDLIFDIKPMSVYFLNFDNPDVNFVPEMIEHIEEIIKKYYIS